MAFYAERQRLKAIAQREANGESLWTSKAPVELRYKILRLAKALERELQDGRASYLNSTDVLETAQILLTRDMGKPYLYSDRLKESPDMESYILHGSDESLPNALEGLYSAMEHLDAVARSTPISQRFELVVNRHLEDYRINYTIESGEVIPFESRDLHVEVVLPTLRLLARPGWEKIEASYQEAIREVGNGKPDDAVTDATTALQDALKQLGCTGKDMPTLITSAKKTIMKGADEKYADAISLLLKWSSASRVNDGDTHTHSDVDKSRAWLVIHTVGILLLYLSESETSQ